MSLISAQALARHHHIEESQVARVEWLADEGRDVEAVDLLATINARDRNPASEIRLVDLRARAAASYTTGVARSPWPPVYPDPFPALDRHIPAVDVEQLTTDMLGGRSPTTAASSCAACSAKRTPPSSAT